MKVSSHATMYAIHGVAPLATSSTRTEHRIKAKCVKRGSSCVVSLVPEPPTELPSTTGGPLLKTGTGIKVSQSNEKRGISGVMSSGAKQVGALGVDWSISGSFVFLGLDFKFEVSDGTISTAEGGSYKAFGAEGSCE